MKEKIGNVELFSTTPFLEFLNQIFCFVFLVSVLFLFLAITTINTDGSLVCNKNKIILQTEEIRRDNDDRIRNKNILWMITIASFITVATTGRFLKKEWLGYKEMFEGLLKSGHGD